MFIPGSMDRECDTKKNIVRRLCREQVASKKWKCPKSWWYPQIKSWATGYHGIETKKWPPLGIPHAHFKKETDQPQSVETLYLRQIHTMEMS